jgi:arylsulfatase A-like enzyme
MKLSRRDFLKVAGLGAAAAGLSSIAPVIPAQASAKIKPLAIPMPEEMASSLLSRLRAEGSTDPLAAETVRIAENMEPVIPHETQAAQAKKKLDALAAKTGKKPNILIILMDNVGYGDFGINGGGLLAGAPTPNIDRLGYEGLHLLSAYSQPSCTPTRCTLLTGRLPIRHGQLRPSFAGEPGGLGDEITVASLLSKAGYMTQAVGKWHCGENEDSQPHNVGFDDFYGFLGWSGLYTDWQDEDFAPDFALNPDRQAYVQTVPFNPHIVHGVKGQEIENLEEITLEVSALLDEKFAAYSVDFIKDMAKSDQPFFLYHCTRGAHFKNYPNPKFKGKSPAKYPYKDCIVELDDIVGRLVKTLQDTGQLENTLIFVTSDNGPLMEPWPDAGFTPFRGGIGSTWEGGVRVPAVVYWKGMITPGQVNDGLFDFNDFFPTLLDLAGATNLIPKDRYIDGIDQTSFLLADQGLSNRKYVYYWLQDIYSGHRVAEYKFVFAGMSFDEFDVINADTSTVLENYKNGKLFNLYLDPKERYSYLNRQTFMDSIASEPYQKHMATFQKYPPKKPISKP